MKYIEIANYAVRSFWGEWLLYRTPPCFSVNQIFPLSPSNQSNFHDRSCLKYDFQEWSFQKPATSLPHFLISMASQTKPHALRPASPRAPLRGMDARIPSRRVQSSQRCLEYSMPTQGADCADCADCRPGAEHRYWKISWRYPRCSMEYLPTYWGIVHDIYDYVNLRNSKDSFGGFSPQTSPEAVM